CRPGGFSPTRSLPMSSGHFMDALRRFVWRGCRFGWEEEASERRLRPDVNRFVRAGSNLYSLSYTKVTPSRKVGLPARVQDATNEGSTFRTPLKRSLRLSPRSNMTDPLRQEVVAGAHTVVIKVGTNVLADAAGQLDRRRIESLVHQLHRVRSTGRKVVLVTSGAIGAGVGKLGL